jgi:hypothetical protein
MTRRPLRRAAVTAACAGLIATLSPAAHAAQPDVRAVVSLRDGSAARQVADQAKRKGLQATANPDGRTVTVRGRADLVKALKGQPGVAHVAGLGPQRPWRHQAIPAGHTGATLRNAYDVVAGSGAGLTVATVQFSGWNPDDLTTYAAAAGLTDPQPVEVVLAGGTSRDFSNQDGAFEVALDQEVLLAAAPQAAQRIYFGPNTGLADAVLLYSQIAADAEAGLVDVVSTSWGMCEPFADLDPEGRAAVEQQLARIVAAGATIFAASGDMGAYDCSSPAEPDATVAVDFPAASPNVVAVGGTRLTGSTGSWAETAWSQPQSGAFKGYASGGGASSTVARPAWQEPLGLSGSTRLVPDVASMADPGTGFGAYAAAYGGWVLGGGTSAGAPLLAGSLASVLSAAGRTSGVGDIHDELYANPGAFRDVTSGGNFVYTATAGYDRVTGLGSPVWSAVGDALLGEPVVRAPAVTRTRTVPLTVTPPAGKTVTAWTVQEVGTTTTSIACTGSLAEPPATVTLSGADGRRRIAVAAQTADGCLVGTAPVFLDTTRPVATGGIKPLAYDNRTVFSWGATDPAPATGTVAYDICVYALGSGCVWTTTATTARSATLSLSQGRTYVLRVTPVDRAGNRGARVSTGRYTVPLDQTKLSRSGGWTAVGSLSDWYGSHYGSGVRGAYLGKVLAGTRYDVMYLAHPKGGTFDVYVSGRLVKRVSTYAAVKTYRKTTTVFTGGRASRAVRVVVRSGHVSVDAVRVAY